MYHVFYLNNFVKSFRNRDDAIKFVHSKPDLHDYEILDRSDV